VISEVHNMDCLAFMRSLPDNAFALAIADPPYGLPASSSRTWSDKSALKDRAFSRGKIGETWDKAPPPEFFAELRRVSENQIIWGGNYFDLPPTRCVVCWDKCQPWENFSQWEMAWTSFDKPAPLFRFDNRTPWKIHPTQKPVELYSWLLGKFWTGGGRVRPDDGQSVKPHRRIPRRGGFRRVRTRPGILRKGQRPLRCGDAPTPSPALA